MKLRKLADDFQKFICWLLPQHIAHGDLKPDNIIIKSDGSIVLIDYDGMFVPVMFGQKHVNKELLCFNIEVEVWMTLTSILMIIQRY